MTRRNIMAEAKITRLADDLHLVTLCPPISGFEDFISAWVLTGPTQAVVDVGPSDTDSGRRKADCDSVLVRANGAKCLVLSETAARPDLGLRRTGSSKPDF